LCRGIIPDQSVKEVQCIRKTKRELRLTAASAPILQISSIRCPHRSNFFTEYISDHEGWELIEVYSDEGITGTSTKKRDNFNRMIKNCEEGKIDTILAKDVSRFARNTIDTLTYTRKLSDLGINVIFLNDGIDISDKDDELRLSIMASIAQEES